MIPAETLSRNHEVLKLRLETLILIRWLAIAGQFSAVMIVAYVMKFEFHIFLCLTVIACSAVLNTFLRLRFRANFRVSENAAVALLAFDILQLALLLYLTGGLQNPFSLLLIVPVIISAATHSYRQILFLGALAVFSVSFLSVYHLPLPWYSGQQPEIPQLLVVGLWFAINAGLVFTAIYSYRLANEGRKQSNALMATEVILQREHYLSSLDGLAAAAAHELGTPLATIALVSKEMSRELPADSPLIQDAQLLRSQAARCSDILNKLTSLPDGGEEHIGLLSLASILDEVVEPHRNFGIEFSINVAPDKDIKQPVFVRNTAMIYGLGNLVENAMDFAVSRVEIDARWDANSIKISIVDDGPGYSRELLGHIGEPYISTRNSKKSESGGGLGLGLFIAKTLLERSGAALDFGRGKTKPMTGAKITISWPMGQLVRQLEEFKKQTPQKEGK